MFARYAQDDTKSVEIGYVNNGAEIIIPDSVASIGDAHTRILLVPSEYDYLRSLPISLRIIDGNWYLQATDKAHEGLLGWQVTAINGLPLREVLALAAQLNSHENQVVLQNGCAADICFADALKYLGVTDDITEVNITLKDPASGFEETAVFLSYQGRELFDVETVIWQPEQPTTAMADAMYLSREIEQGAYFIQYNACVEDSSYPMKDFAKDIQDDCEGERYQKVIVDLRYNGGGNSAVLKPVMDVLQAQQKECISMDGIQWYMGVGSIGMA